MQHRSAWRSRLQKGGCSLLLVAQPVLPQCVSVSRVVALYCGYIFSIVVRLTQPMHLERRARTLQLRLRLLLPPPALHAPPTPMGTHHNAVWVSTACSKHGTGSPTCVCPACRSAVLHPGWVPFICSAPSHEPTLPCSLSHSNPWQSPFTPTQPNSAISPAAPQPLVWC